MKLSSVTLVDVSHGTLWGCDGPSIRGREVGTLPVEEQWLTAASHGDRNEYQSVIRIYTRCAG